LSILANAAVSAANASSNSATSDPSQNVPPPVHYQESANAAASGASSEILTLASTLSSTADLYGSTKATNKIRTLTGTTKIHKNRKEKILYRFFSILACHELFVSLCEQLPHPFEKNKFTRKFFVLFGGKHVMSADYEATRYAMNATIVWFYKNLRLAKFDDEETDWENAAPVKTAQAQYKMSSLSTINKCLFSAFKQNGILLQSHSFKTLGEGSFHFYLSDRAMETSKHRSDYGDVTRAAVDFHEEEKFRNPTQAWNLDDPKDLQLICIRQMLNSFALRGQEEVCFRSSKRFTV